MNNPDKNCDRFYYRIVIVGIDGKRDVLAKNLYRTIAESVARSLSKSERGVVLERQNGIEPA